jgi:hypothetical protein
MELGIKIGHDKDAVDNIGKLIRAIMNAPTDDYVKVKALEAMKSALSINNTSFSNCYIGDNTHNNNNDEGEYK